MVPKVIRMTVARKDVNIDGKQIPSGSSKVTTITPDITKIIESERVSVTRKGKVIYIMRVSFQTTCAGAVPNPRWQMDGIQLPYKTMKLRRINASLVFIPIASGAIRTVNIMQDITKVTTADMQAFTTSAPTPGGTVVNFFGPNTLRFLWGGNTGMSGSTIGDATRLPQRTMPNVFGQDGFNMSVSVMEAVGGGLGDTFNGIFDFEFEVIDK